jgi:hypothetical protein
MRPWLKPPKNRLPPSTAETIRSHSPTLISARPALARPDGSDCEFPTLNPVVDMTFNSIKVTTWTVQKTVMLAPTALSHDSKVLKHDP